MSHLVLGLEVPDYRHVLVEGTVGDDLLPLGYRASVPLFNRGKIRRWPLLRPRCDLIRHVVILLEFGWLSPLRWARSSAYSSTGCDIHLPADAESVDETAED